MTSDPYQSYESMDYGKGHGKGHPKVPEPAGTGALILGLLILFAFYLRWGRGNKTGGK